MTKFKNLAASALLMAAAGDGTEGAAGADVPAVVPNGKEFSFFFKSREVKDTEGKVISIIPAHPTVAAVLPVTQGLDVIEIMSHLGETELTEDGKTSKPTVGSKVAQLVLEMVQDLHYQAARGQINDWLEKNEGKQFSATNFDLSKLTLEFIAQQERGSRGAWAPSEDDMKAFCEDYTVIFVQEVQYDVKKVKVHCDQFVGGYKKIKNDKIALRKMLEFLTIWASKTNNMDALLDTYGWLVARANKYATAEEKDFASAL